MKTCQRTGQAAARPLFVKLIDIALTVRAERQQHRGIGAEREILRPDACGRMVEISRGSTMGCYFFESDLAEKKPNPYVRCADLLALFAKRCGDSVTRQRLDVLPTCVCGSEQGGDLAIH